MFLDSNKKLVAVLTTAKTTLNLPVTVDYVDLTATTTTPAPAQTYTNGITPVDILSAPAASTIRKVNGLSIYERDTASKIIRIYTIDATPTTGLITAGAFITGNDYQIVSIGTTDFTLIGASANTVGVIFTATGVGAGTGTAATAYQHIDLQIQIDDTLCYTDTGGWYTVDAQGNLKSVQAASATAIATAIHSATDKTIPVGADEIGIWDSVTGLLNKVRFTNIFKNFSLMPSVASAATVDIFGAVGATIDLTGTTTVTGLTACTDAQVGSKKTVIPSNASGVSFTASANMLVDGATSGTYLMPQNAIVEVMATSTTTFKITTIFAQINWTPTYELATQGTANFGTYGAQSGKAIKIGNKVTAYAIVIGGTFSLGTGSGALFVAGLPWANNSTTAGTAVLNNAEMYVTLAPTHGRLAATAARIEFTNASGATYTQITSAHCASSLRTEFAVEYFV